MAGTSAQPAELDLNGIYVFGDSLSDTGNRAHLRRSTALWFWLVRTIGGFFCDKLKCAFPGGRFSNGPVAVEEIAKRLSVDLQPAWKVKGGTNFAVGAALAAGRNEVPSLQQQIDKCLESMSGQDPSPANALCIVYIGGNDIAKAAKKPTIGEGEDMIDTAVRNIEACMRQLMAEGAKIFLVPDRGDIGNAPMFRVPWSRPGSGRRATRLSLYFNLRLAAALDRLEAEKDCTIIRFDSFTFGRKLRADAAQHGWTNLASSCLMADCDAQFENFFFFDRIHPTAKRHRINGDALYGAVSAAFR